MPMREPTIEERDRYAPPAALAPGVESRLAEVRVPEIGTKVAIHAGGSNEWEAIVVGFTPGGCLRVRSAAYPTGHVQTINRSRDCRIEYR